MAPLKWSSKSLRKISQELKQQGWSVSEKSISRILYDDLKYSLQGLQKSKEGTRQHPDRDQQFQYLSRCCREFQERGQPVISVDAKKKELIGDFKNGGREWQPQGEPESVRVHDFEDKELGKGIPYGIYDTGRNEGWVSVGVDRDTAQFAVSSIRNWWWHMGQKVYPHAQELLITADAGGSNGYRVKLWKRESQKLANETGLRLMICHFPPGTSKWNRIEHRNVLPHHRQLAGSTVEQFGSDCQSDCRNQNGKGFEHPGGRGPGELRERHRSIRRGNVTASADAR